MNSQKMYIPNMEKWSKYYENVVQGKNNSYINYMHNMGKNGSFMIPVEKPTTVKDSTAIANEKCKIQLVSPSAQMVEMAKETLQEEGIKRKTKKRKRTLQKKSKPIGRSFKKEKKDVFS